MSNWIKLRSIDPHHAAASVPPRALIVPDKEEEKIKESSLLSVTGTSLMPKVLKHCLKKKQTANSLAFIASLLDPQKDQISARSAIRALFQGGEEFETTQSHYSRLISAAGPQVNDEQLGVNYFNWSTKFINAFADAASFGGIFDEYRFMGVDVEVGSVMAGQQDVIGTALNQGVLAIGYEANSNTAPATTMTTNSMDRPNTKMFAPWSTAQPKKYSFPCANPQGQISWADATVPATVVSGGTANNGCIYFLAEPNELVATGIIYGYLCARGRFRYRLRF